MGLVKCNECGKEISDKAEKCIHCGCPIKDINVENSNTIIKKVEKKGNIRDNKKLSKLEIVLCILFIAGLSLYLGMSSVDKKSTTSTSGYDGKHIGCYYITDSYDGKKDYRVSLCLEKDKITFNYDGKSATLKPIWHSTEVIAENSYGEIMFYCRYNSNDNDTMKCDSHSKVLGTGTWYFKK